MSKSTQPIKIPDNMQPMWHCCINGVCYSYTAGTAQIVPDEVAAVIKNYYASVPDPKKADNGKVMVTVDGGAAWGDVPAATVSKIGGVKMAAPVADAASAPTKAEFNALLKALRNAGVILHT